MARRSEEIVPKHPAYFWWLLANALALCFAVISWAVCLDVFGNPEVPRNYEILAKLNRLPVLKRYIITDVPDGNSLGPKELYQKYFGYEDEESVRINSLLVRNYISNFDRPLFLTYVEGDYQIRDVRMLSSQNFITSGIAIRAQALVKPDDFTKPLPYPVFIEYLLPTHETAAISSLKVGDLMTLKKSPHCGAVVHVSKILNDGESALLLAVVPIAYGTQQLEQDNPADFQVEPPSRIQPAAKFPAFK